MFRFQTPRLMLVLGVLLGSGSLAVTAVPSAHGQPPAAAQSASSLPRPDFKFPGTVGRTYKTSDPPQFPQPVKAPAGAPNVVLILLDDSGFGQYSTFGGGIPAPTLDKLAAEGLKYNRFHKIGRAHV